MSQNLDGFDLKLLSELQHDSALTSEKLAQKVGLSPSAVHRRVRRLEQTGVVERRIGIVDPAKVGRSAFFVAAVEVDRERPELVQKLRDWMRSEPAVQQAYYVTGTADYMLLVTARDIAEFDRLMSDMMVANPNVRRFTTNVVMGTVKRGLFVPVDVS
jgi:Lrp/AsnC family transcriptional regulator, leucine-responsive regulatory protein